MKLETVDYLADDAAEQFVRSLRETGFGVLKNHRSEEHTSELQSR